MASRVTTTQLIAGLPVKLQSGMVFFVFPGYSRRRVIRQ
jgi:hypothetical protein